jgi:hypothetical protein
MGGPCGAMSRQLSALRSPLSALSFQLADRSHLPTDTFVVRHHGKRKRLRRVAFLATGRMRGQRLGRARGGQKSRTPRAAEMPKSRSTKGIASCRLRSFVLRPSVDLGVFDPRNFFSLPHSFAVRIAAPRSPVPEGRLKMAPRFIAGSRKTTPPLARPGGTPEPELHRSTVPAGRTGSVVDAFPAMNRGAIFRCPSGTARGDAPCRLRSFALRPSFVLSPSSFPIPPRQIVLKLGQPLC